MPKAYKIVFDIDDSRAKAKMKAAGAGFASLEKQAMAFATSLEKALGRAGGASAKSVNAIAAAVGNVGNAASAANASAGRMAAGFRAAAAQATNLGNAMAGGTAKAAQAQAAFFRQGNAGFAQMSKAASQFAAAQQSAIGSVQHGLGGANSAGMELHGTFGRLAGAAVGVGTLKAAWDGVTGAIVSANEQSQLQVDKLLETMNLVREITMMTGGKNGVGAPELRQHFGIRTESGLTAQQAASFATEFHGAGEAAKGQNISGTEFDRAEPMIAKFAAAAGGGAEAPGTYGKLAGLLMGLKKFDKAEDVLAATTQFNKILSVGVGENPVLIRQAAQVAGAYIGDDEETGRMKSDRELAAVTATASRVSPTRAAQIMKSSSRVLFGGKNEKWSGMLTKAGVDENKDSYTEASEKVFELMDAAVASGRNPEAFLKDMGVTDAGATSVASMYKYRELTRKMMADNATPMTGAQAVAELDQKFRADKGLRIGRRQAMLDQTTTMNAEALLPGRELDLEAQERLARRGEGMDSGAARAEDWTAGAWMSNLGITLPSGMGAEELGRKARIEREKFRILQEKGVKMPTRPVDGMLGPGSEYVNWLTGGTGDQDYAAAASGLDLMNQVMPKKAAPPVVPPAAAIKGAWNADGVAPGMPIMGLRGMLAANMVGAVGARGPDIPDMGSGPGGDGGGYDPRETNQLLREQTAAIRDLVAVMKVKQVSPKPAPPQGSPPALPGPPKAVAMRP